MTSKGARSSQWSRPVRPGRIHGVVRWRLIDLAQWVLDEYRISVTKQMLSRELRALGYRKLSARPRHHAHDEAAVVASKTRTSWRRSPRPASGLELSFQDEARIGQKNKVTRRWAERGTRLFALKDQRTASAYIFGAIYSALARRPVSSSPSNTKAMTHLSASRRSPSPSPGAHAICSSIRPGWHVTAKLGVPEKHDARPPAVQVTRAQSRRT